MKLTNEKGEQRFETAEELYDGLFIVAGAGSHIIEMVFASDKQCETYRVRVYDRTDGVCEIFNVDNIKEIDDSKYKSITDDEFFDTAEEAHMRLLELIGQLNHF